MPSLVAVEAELRWSLGARGCGRGSDASTRQLKLGFWDRKPETVSQKAVPDNFTSDACVKAPEERETVAAKVRTYVA
jgi:hypothetical protein